jgi:intracellular septation protein A
MIANPHLDRPAKIRCIANMAFTWWRYPTRRFSIDGINFEVRSRGRSDGLHSSLSMLGVESATDQSPIYGEEAVRNHRLACTLPDGRKLEVELGYIGAWTTGIIARLDGQMVHESHPGKTPQYPEKYRKDITAHSSFKEAIKAGSAGQPNPFETGVFAKHNRLPFAIDVATGLLFFVIAKMTNLQTAAMAGIFVGFALVAFQYFTKIDVTGGLALFGIVMLCISAGLAWISQDEEWIKLRGTLTGVIAASFFLIDGLRGGPYIGKGLARYMPYDDIDKGRLAVAMGLVGLFMAGLNYGAAKLLSTDQWLFYTTFIDFFIVMALAIMAMRWSRRAV